MSKFKTRFFDHVAAVDFETHYGPNYTLTSKQVSMTEYIWDERFEAQTCAVQHDTWKHAEVAVGHREIKQLLDEIDWGATAFLGHHTQFDGLIATHHFDTYPVFWLDNMAISRAVYGADVPHSHAALSARLGRAAKKNADALKEAKGKYLRDMSPELIEYLKRYNKDDAEETLANFSTIWQYLPFEELRIIDATLRMYCEPILELDTQLLQDLHRREANRRAGLVEVAGTTASVLGSAPKFADLLRSLGVEPPMKISPKTKKPTFAFAKTDLDFKALLGHPNEAVRRVVEARLANKGSIVESRSKRLLQRAGRPTPVYLSYAAARTLRWGGGDLANWQNLPSGGDGANIRRAILAPPGTKIIGSDASQVEARMTAWLSGFEEKLDAFRLYDRGLGPDMYCRSAEGIYGRTITKADDPFERFIGKVFELSCQYGAGAVKVRHTLAQGFRGAPPVFMELHEVKSSVNRWRKANAAITNYWKRIETNARNAWLFGSEIEDGPLVFEKFKDDGYIHFPNGTFMKYTNAHYSEKEGSLVYVSKNGPVKLWGGHMLENVSQGLCCALLKWHMIQIMDAIGPDFFLALTVHDELVGLCGEDEAERITRMIREIMSTTPDYLQGLPLNAAAAYGDCYEKAE